LADDTAGVKPNAVKWEGATVFITGASRGIGREVAKAAAQRGARVGLIARSGDELAAVLRDVGGRGAIAVADVGDRAAATNAIAQLESEVGPADILVANAGIGAYGAFAEIDLDLVERLVRVNLLGTMYAIRAVLPGMVARHRGHIVVIGSIAGRIGAPFEAAYSATKFGQVGLTEAIATEVGNRGVGVSLVNPGPVTTDFFDARGHAYDGDFPKPVSPERVTAAVMRAVDKNRFEQVVPSWLGRAVVLRHLVPPLLRWGTERRFRDLTKV
jgi:3-oxoacyl-[acyl-carrier protein] reductase